MDQRSNSFLETEKIGRLMGKYAVPCVISLVVAALYNIVDQIFIANADYLGSYVIVGRCADYILRDRADCLRVFIHADMASRAKRIVEQYGQRAITLLRRCGHFLHHNPEVAVLPEALTEQERTQLESLLEKCLTLWQA